MWVLGATYPSQSGCCWSFPCRDSGGKVAVSHDLICIPLITEEIEPFSYPCQPFAYLFYEVPEAFADFSDGFSAVLLISKSTWFSIYLNMASLVLTIFSPLCIVQFHFHNIAFWRKEVFNFYVTNSNFLLRILLFWVSYFYCFPWVLWEPEKWFPQRYLH